MITAKPRPGQDHFGGGSGGAAPRRPDARRAWDATAVGPSATAVNAAAAVMSSSAAAVGPAAAGVGSATAALNPATAALNPATAALNPATAALNPATAALSPAAAALGAARHYADVDPASFHVARVADAFNADFLGPAVKTARQQESALGSTRQEKNFAVAILPIKIFIQACR